MPDDSHPFQSQERRSSIFRIVELAAEVGKGLPRQQRSYLGSNCRGQRIFQQEAYRFHQPFRNLERHVADKTVTDDDIYFAVVQVAAFYVAQKIEWQVF